MEGGDAVDFVAVMEQAIALLRQRGRVTYRTLQLQLTLDDEQLAALKEELLYSQPQVRDDTGRGLIWTDDADPVLAGTPAPVAYLLAADNVSRPLSTRLRRANQPIITTRNVFSLPRPPLLTCI